MIQARRSEVILMAGMLVVFGVTLLDILERSGLFDTTTLRIRTLWSNLGNAAAIAVFELLASFSVLCFCSPRGSPGKARRHPAFQTLRAIQLTSGLSPILPIFFLLAAGLWWANHTASGWILLDSRRPRLPFGIQQPRLAAIGEDREIASELLSELLPGASSITHYLALLGIGFGIWLLVGSLHPLRTIEPWRFDRVTMPLFLIIAWAGLVGTTLRLWSIWFRAHQLLSVLDSVPLRRGFQRLEGFSWKPIWKFGGGGALDEYRRVLAREREALESAVNLLPQLESSKQKINRRFRQTLSWYRIARSFKRPFSLRDWAARRKAEQRLIEHFGSFQNGVALAARDALDYLAERWSQEKEEPRRRAGQATEDELKTRACERFVSLVYVSFLLAVLARIRTLIVAIGGMYILILLAMTLYPFEPKAAIQAFLAASLVFIVAVVGLVFGQIHRDATLSHITDTKPGELGVDFWLRMASFVALPLFSLFASQFPEIGRFFYSWLEPALRALNHYIAAFMLPLPCARLSAKRKSHSPFPAPAGCATASDTASCSPYRSVRATAARCVDRPRPKTPRRERCTEL